MKRTAMKVLAVLSVAVLAACGPRFEEGAEISAVADADSIEFSWPEAAPVKPESPIELYQLWVDGEVVWELSHEQPRTCDLVGLVPGEPVVVWVRAVDVSGAGSNLLEIAVDGPPESDASGSLYCDLGLPPIEM